MPSGDDGETPAGDRAAGATAAGGTAAAQPADDADDDGDYEDEDDEDDDEPVSGAAATEPVPAGAEAAAAATVTEPAAGADDIAGARLIALNMALNGTPREETDRYLQENFELADRDQLLDEVYGNVEE